MFFDFLLSSQLQLIHFGIARISTLNAHKSRANQEHKLVPPQVPPGPFYGKSGSLQRYFYASAVLFS